MCRIKVYREPSLLRRQEVLDLAEGLQAIISYELSVHGDESGRLERRVIEVRNRINGSFDVGSARLRIEIRVPHHPGRDTNLQERVDRITQQIKRWILEHLSANAIHQLLDTKRNDEVFVGVELVRAASAMF